LNRAIELAPGFLSARQNLVMLHLRKGRFLQAMDEVGYLVDQEPNNPAFLNLEGVALARIGNYEDAVNRFRAVLDRRPHHARIWLSYGHTLKTLGRKEECIRAYRTAISQQVALGEAWWSLANLKAFRFDTEDIATMEGVLKNHSALSDDDRLHVHFALGKAYEDDGNVEPSFAHYLAANNIRAQQLRYDPQPLRDFVEAAKGAFTVDFFTSREEFGNPSGDPIFVVGMPRSGSTLVEQILSSHSGVEGTHELPQLEMLARELAPFDARLVAALLQITPEKAAQIGRDYIEKTKVYRKAGRVHFIDKMPNNWALVPLIKLILPNAKVIDTRRGAMACCFSNFKQHFARGQAFSYQLVDVGNYYKQYVEFMAWIDTVCPGFVIRVDHEHMVDNPNDEIRRLLSALGLPFEEACLSFWRTERAVQTASSEQVRQPIFKDGIDQWAKFKPFLSPLEQTLGDLAQ
jgi:tetratricopeptide (TPR) repeat protein